MLPITYYFWNSYKKSGYVRGKLDRPEYEKQVTNGGKDSNIFVKNLVSNILEDQEKTINDSITTLEIENNEYSKEIRKYQLNITDEERIVNENFDKAKEKIDEEKNRIKKEFDENCLVDNAKLNGAKELLGNLVNDLGNYAKEVKEQVKSQKEKLLNQWNNALKHNGKLTINEIKNAILPNEITAKTKEEGKVRIDKKSIGYLRILILFCIFDVFLGYFGIVKFVMLVIESIRWAKIVAAFLALVLIPIAMLIVHASIIAKNRGGIYKQLGNIMIIFIVFLLFLYACQSTSKTEWSNMWNSIPDFISVIKSNSEFLIRLFIIPSLFAGEIFVDLIDWNSIINYLGIGKKGTRNRLSKLLANGLIFLKKNKISNFAKEEAKEITNLVMEMEKEEVPAFKEINNNIKEIEGVLNPILDKQAKKAEEYNNKMARINEELDNNIKKYNDEIQEIKDKYQPKINEYEQLKKRNEQKIESLKREFSQAVIDVKGGILLGLIDK